MPVEDQVVQIYAATNGYLDRIAVDKVERFLRDLTASVRANQLEVLEKVAAGDWDESTQSAVEAAVAQFAKDFGYDLDEEGHPLEDEDESDRATQPPEIASEAPADEKEEEAVPA
jgi:F-type H+/Na+-transporting ATPase subunit alpha